MRSTSTFVVPDFEPTDWTPEISTGLPVGEAHMTKRFSGGLEGHSVTSFTGAFDPKKGIGTYIAMESVDGTLDGRRGAFNLVHTATTRGEGNERLHEFVLIVPGSGTGDLEGITGTGALRITDDGTHHLDLDYELDTGAP